ncbi:hypothetical protein AB0D08_36155 [Kitasatospora sp. NPDC048540]
MAKFEKPQASSETLRGIPLAAGPLPDGTEAAFYLLENAGPRGAWPLIVKRDVPGADGLPEKIAPDTPADCLNRIE